MLYLYQVPPPVKPQSSLYNTFSFYYVPYYSIIVNAMTRAQLPLYSVNGIPDFRFRFPPKPLPRFFIYRKTKNVL